MPPEGSPTNPEPTEKDDPKTFSRTEDGQDHVPTLEQLTQTVAQIQQQYKHLVAWQVLYIDYHALTIKYDII